MDLKQNLNEFLADLNVFYRKLQNYHWNIEGSNFFEVHAKLEELYNEIAEHILILGGQPLGTLKDYLETSTLKEAENKKVKSNEIFVSLINDYGELLKKAIEIKESSEKESEYSTSSLIDEYILEYEKIIWMLRHVTA